jgi:hypothetical protein
MRPSAIVGFPECFFPAQKQWGTDMIGVLSIREADETA